MTEKFMTVAPTTPLNIPVATAGSIPGRTISGHVGMTFGVVVRSVGFTRSVTGGIRALRRGEVKQYTDTIEQARRAAVERLVEHAEAMGADAVVEMRFDSADVGGGLAEIVAYGTGVTLAD